MDSLFPLNDYRQPPDPTAGKHGGSPFSEAAFDRLVPHLKRCQEEVLAVIREAGGPGATAKEVARRLGKGLNAVSPRVFELRKAGQIKATGESRERSAVYVAIM